MTLHEQMACFRRRTRARLVRQAGLSLALWLVSVGCQSTAACEAAIEDHPWSRALAEKAESGVVDVSVTSGSQTVGTAIVASVPFVRVSADSTPSWTIVCLHGDPGGKEVWAPAILGQRPGSWAFDYPIEEERVPAWRRGTDHRRRVIRQEAGAVQWEGLGRSFDVIALDLPGHGQCDTTPRVWHPQDAALVVQAALARIAAARPLRGSLVLMGHSFGGEVAWRLASLPPKPNLRFERLVLVDSVGMRRLSTEIQSSEETLAGWLVGGVLGGMTGAFECNARGGLEELHAHDGVIDLNHTAPLYRAFTNRGSNYAASREITLRDIDREDDVEALGRLRSIAIPALLVWGARDPAWTVVTQAHAFRDALTNSRLAVIADCGHLPTEERPDLLCDLVENWLADRPPGVRTALRLQDDGDTDRWFLQNLLEHGRVRAEARANDLPELPPLAGASFLVKSAAPGRPLESIRVSLELDESGGGLLLKRSDHDPDKVGSLCWRLTLEFESGENAGEKIVLCFSRVDLLVFETTASVLQLPGEFRHEATLDECRMLLGQLEELRELNWHLDRIAMGRF